ncbi:MAG: insulinase family protein, partial [Candidatus Yanofskybacteria bacterium]|nr:insulinase family protein [Candidatus Yanofskybacteria bacterium]
MEGTKTVTVLVLVGTGSKYETKDINGISHFLEH